ncbi:MAG: hypothetical protein M0008_03240 [Actinomycetota bacterium]|nr:hypothetical protein [Actinomycetota bacterium]
MSQVGVLANILVGVITSFGAWMVLTKLLRPHVEFGEYIEELYREDGTIAYRLKYWNSGLRRIQDVTVYVRLYYKSRETPVLWKSIWIPIDDPFKPSIRKARLTQRILAWRLLKVIFEERSRRISLVTQHPVLLLDEITGRNSPDWELLMDGSATSLRKFLEDRIEATLELSVKCADGYSGTYRTFVKKYQKQNLPSKARKRRRIVQGQSNDK